MVNHHGYRSEEHIAPRFSCLDRPRGALGSLAHPIASAGLLFEATIVKSPCDIALGNRWAARFRIITLHLDSIIVGENRVQIIVERDAEA